MKTKYYFLSAIAAFALASCTSEDYLGDSSPTLENGVTSDGSIKFGLNVPNMTRTGEFVGATAAEKLGGMFVVEGTKGSEQTNSPSTTVVFDNYLVGYTANTAGTTESNTHNWEYVGKQTGIDGRMNSTTWNALHAGSTDAKVQSVKYWDYSVAQYDFIAWSTGDLEAITGDPVSGTSVKVTRINTGAALSTTSATPPATPGGFTLKAASAADLKKCYYTDINTVPKANYGQPVTLTFRNMAAKVRVALYETVPGYSVKEVQFYTEEAANPAQPADLNYSQGTAATLFTLGEDKFPQSGSVLVYYPHIGTNGSDKDDYNKASVTVTPDVSTVTTQGFGTLNYTGRETTYEVEDDIYLGRNINAATYAGAVGDGYYTAVIPNTTGMPLTLRVNYTLVSTDGSNETIKVYGAKAVVPATYTVWQPNYAYTYIFKISDNTNGWTSTAPATDPAGLFPITFDAVVTNFVDANAEQTTVTTVATPSITTYQQGHNHENKDEYSKSQLAGVDDSNVKDLYVQVMDNSTATPTLKTDLKGTGATEGKKSLLYAITGTAPISEATVMDALQNRKQTIETATPINGRNGMILTKNDNIANNVTSIVNGVNDQPITVVEGTAAKIDIDQLGIGTYAYVYANTVPTTDEIVYHVAADATSTSAVEGKYYDVNPTSIVAETSGDDKAVAGKVYFVANKDAEDNIVSYTFKQTKVGDNVAGLYEATIPGEKASTYTEGHFYFDVYYQNNGSYAVKVIKVAS